MRNPDQYNYVKEYVKGEFHFTIDLDNLESNIGQKVYQDGKCYIDIQMIDIADGHYRIHFRSHGSYDINNACLISGASQKIDSYKAEASLYCVSDSNSYPCSIAGISGVGYRDGDSFSFYIPQEAVMEDTHTLFFIFCNLVQNIWTKK